MKGNGAGRGGLTNSDFHPANELWAAAVREFREARKLSLADVAERTGLCELAIQKIEEGECRPRLDSLLRICDAIEVPFAVMALVVWLRLEGRAVQIARVLRRLRGLRRFLFKIAGFQPSGQSEK